VNVADAVQSGWTGKSAVNVRAGELADARRALEAVVARSSRDPRAEAALLDLARMALADGNAGDAARQLARLPDPPTDRALAEPAHRLRCRTELARGDQAAAASCLAAFRRRFPASPHDAEALSLLAGAAATCERAAPLLDEYLRRYPRGPFASDAHARLRACGRE
jgi:outer membrane protein assembly factor BamD (BamD/ComL family)